MFALCLNFLSVLMETATAGFSTAAPQCCFLGLFYFPGWVAVTDHSAAQEIAAMSPQKLPRQPCQRCDGCPKAQSLSPKSHPSCRARSSRQGREGELSRAVCGSRGELYNCALACVCSATALWGRSLTSRQGKERTTTQNKKQLQVKQVGARWGCWTLVPAQGKQAAAPAPDTGAEPGSRQQESRTGTITCPSGPTTIPEQSPASKRDI